METQVCPQMRHGARGRRRGLADTGNAPRTQFNGAGVTPTVPHGMLPVMAGLRLRRQMAASTTMLTTRRFIQGP